MGRKYVESVEDPHRTFVCCCCKTALSGFNYIRSANYNTQFGEGYLFSHVVNISLGKTEKNGMTSGQYMVIHYVIYVIF